MPEVAFVDPFTGQRVVLRHLGDFRHGSLCPICREVRRLADGDAAATLPPVEAPVDFDLVG
jgi:hypothetical protein